MRINVEEIVVGREPPKKVEKPTPEPKDVPPSELPRPVKRNQKWFDEQKKLRQ
jgi:hypothetical protein